jgi:hypothetical protein
MDINVHGRASQSGVIGGLHDGGVRILLDGETYLGSRMTFCPPASAKAMATIARQRFNAGPQSNPY